MSIPTTFVANTPALAADVNTNFTDVATALTGSLALDGQSAMTGQFKAADGSITAPGMAFGSDLNTGFYRSASGVIRGTCDGTNSFTLTAAGATVTGVLTATSLSVSGFGLVPAGVICMWSGTVATIPAGWLLCNGSSGTPDLRDRFIIGARQDDAGTAKTNVTGALTQSGGSKDAITVSHTHTATSTVTDPGHTHGIVVPDGGYTVAASGTAAGTAGSSALGNTAKSGSSFLSTSTTGATVATVNNSTGSSGTDANLPPYYALAFIMKS
jgi:hypothetical protein